MAKFYTVEKEIDGVKYVAQFSGARTAVRAMDECYIDGTGNTSMEKFGAYIFENVIVEPKGLTIDDFDDLDTYNKVVMFGRKVMTGEEKPAAPQK